MIVPFFNLAREVDRRIRRALAEDHFRAVVVEVSGNTVRIQRTGYSAEPKFYPTGGSYSPTVTDEVIMLRVGSGYVAIDDITR